MRYKGQSMREKTSIIWTTPKTELEKLINESSSLSEILRKLGYTNIEGNHRTLKDRIQKESLNIESLLERGKTIKSNNIKKYSYSTQNSNESIFKEDSKFSRHHLKKKIIKEKLIPYICRDCNNTGIWNNAKLSLHLEHINGVNNDNRITNLCFLCPNCHSQTATYAGKNVKQKRPLSAKRTCPKCGKEKDRQATVCRACYKAAGELICEIEPSLS